MTGDLVAAGVEYIILDDSHFKNAGLDGDQLHGYYLTEDDGRILRVFPGSERLRYVDPVRQPARDDRLSARRRRPASAGGVGLCRRWREVRRLARNEAERLRPGLAPAVVRPAGRQPGLDSDGHAQRGARSGAAAGKSLSARGQLPGNDRMGPPARTTREFRASPPGVGTRSALAAHRPLRARRFLAEFQSSLSRNE